MTAITLSPANSALSLLRRVASALHRLHQARQERCVMAELALFADDRLAELDLTPGGISSVARREADR